MVIGLRIPPSRFKVEAKMKSDQDHRNAKRETVITEFRDKGRMTEKNVRTFDAPSSAAASNSDAGNPDINAVSSIVAKGTAIVASARISPGMVFNNPIWL